MDLIVYGDINDTSKLKNIIYAVTFIVFKYWTKPNKPTKILIAVQLEEKREITVAFYVRLVVQTVMTLFT